jgi:hypothetical protein
MRSSTQAIVFELLNGSKLEPECVKIKGSTIFFLSIKYNQNG